MIVWIYSVKLSSDETSIGIPYFLTILPSQLAYTTLTDMGKQTESHPTDRHRADTGYYIVSYHPTGDATCSLLAIADLLTLYSKNSVTIAVDPFRVMA